MASLKITFFVDEGIMEGEIFKYSVANLRKLLELCVFINSTMGKINGRKILKSE